MGMYDQASTSHKTPHSARAMQAKRIVRNHEKCHMPYTPFSVGLLQFWAEFYWLGVRWWRGGATKCGMRDNVVCWVREKTQPIGAYMRWHRMSLGWQVWDIAAYFMRQFSIYPHVARSRCLIAPRTVLVLWLREWLRERQRQYWSNIWCASLLFRVCVYVCVGCRTRNAFGLQFGEAAQVTTGWGHTITFT